MQISIPCIQDRFFVCVPHKMCPDFQLINGNVFASWGSNHNGQLGLNDSKRRLVPSLIASLRRNGAKHGRIVDISCGGHHALALSSTGKVYVWGRNNHGQLGLGDCDDRSLPEVVVKLRKHRVMQVAAGWRHSLVLTDDNLMLAWGMFGAVKRAYPRNQHDPDADNTQFESHIPLVVPFNHVTSSTNHSTSTTMEFPALRSVTGISAVSSHSISLTMIQWQQKPGPFHTLMQPLLHHSLAVQNKEADNLLIDHKQHEATYAHNLDLVQSAIQKKQSQNLRNRRLSVGAQSLIDRSIKSRSSHIHESSMKSASSPSQVTLVGLTDQELMMSIPVTPIRKRDYGRQNEPISSSRNASTRFNGDPYAVHPVELQGMSKEQLKELVTVLQRSGGHHVVSDDGTSSPKSGGIQTHSRIGMKYGLRVNAGSSPIIKHERERIRSEMTLMEKQHRYQYRDFTDDDYTPVQTAKRRAWNKYHGSRLKISKKKAIQTDGNSPDHLGRKTSPERGFSIEHKLRGELLKFNTYEGSEVGEGKSNQLQLTDKSPDAQSRNYQKALEDERTKLLEAEKIKSKWEKRIGREGIVNDGDVMSLFSPELLVATSNDDMNVSEVIDQVRNRGGSPTTMPHYKDGGKQLIHQEQHTTGEAKQTKRELTAKEVESLAKRDVVSMYREQQLLAMLPTYSSRPESIQIDSDRRLEIENEVLGAEQATSHAPVTPTGILSAENQKLLAAHRGKMMSLGGQSANRTPTKKQTHASFAIEPLRGPSSSLVAPPLPPPPPAPPAGQPPEANSPHIGVSKEHEELIAMRRKLEAIKTENAHLISSIENSTSSSIFQHSERDVNGSTSTSPSLQKRIEAIKAKANADLSELWDASKRAKNIPLPNENAELKPTESNSSQGNSDTQYAKTEKGALAAREVVPLPSISEMLRRKSVAEDR